MIKVVAFDLDNTLYDYDYCNILAERTLYELMSRWFGVDGQQAVRLLSDAKKHVKRQLGNTASAHNRLLYMQNICEQINKNPLHYAQKLYNVYWDTILENMKLFEYVIPVMNAMKARGIKLAIVTDMTAYIQYRKLQKLGLQNEFDILVTSEEAGAEKPSPQIYNLLIAKAGCMPSEIIMIGDDINKDVNGALNMGMHALHYDRESNIKEKVVAIYENVSGNTLL